MTSRSPNDTPPMVSIIGRKHSGKTTIKHGSHTFNLDPAATDTYRHYHEGNADKVAMIAPDKFALVERWSDEVGPEEIAARHMSDADLVVCEGFTRSALPKIEIYRREAHQKPVWDPQAATAPTWRGIVTDADDFRASVPIFRLSDPRWLEELAAFVERDLMSRP
jgi:molybdopterin-guanine dinucleotide biosynthesis protein MobB